jgi:pre-mRNA processing factor 4 (PRP4) like.
MHPARQAYVEETEDTDMGGISYADLRKSFSNSFHLKPTNKAIATDQDYDMSSTAGGIPTERASAILSQFERKRRAAAMVVPTDDTRVRVRLRELGEPITLFGEGPSERRDRLRELLTDMAEQQGGVEIEMEEAEEEGEQQEEFFTEGGNNYSRRGKILRAILCHAQRLAWPGLRTNQQLHFERISSIAKPSRRSYKDLIFTGRKLLVIVR